MDYFLTIRVKIAMIRSDTTAFRGAPGRRSPRSPKVLRYLGYVFIVFFAVLAGFTITTQLGVPESFPSWFLAFSMIT